MKDKELRPHEELADSCHWPFRHHPHYQKVYAPWGVFGPQYDFSNLGAHVDLSGLPIIFCSGKQYKLANFLRRYLLVDRSRTIIAIAVGDYLYLLLPVTARIPLVERRLPFWRALEIASRESDIRLLWLANLFMVGVAGTILFGRPGVAQWILASPFALGAVLLSRMIVWHGTPTRADARQVVRR